MKTLLALLFSTLACSAQLSIKGAFYPASLKPPSSAFSPTSITGMLYYINYADLPLNSTPEYWTDRIGGIIETNSSSSMRPTNALKGMYFDKVNDRLTNAPTTPALTATKPYSFWIVMEPTVISGYETLFGTKSGSDGAFIDNGTKGFRIYPASVVMGALQPNTTYDILWADGVTYTNGVLAGTDNGASASSIVYHSIGDDDSGEPYGGYIKSIAFYDHACTASDATNLHSYSLSMPVPVVAPLVQGAPLWTFLVAGQSLSVGAQSSTPTAGEAADSVFGNYMNDKIVREESTVTNSRGLLKEQLSSAGGTTGWKSFADQLSVLCTNAARTNQGSLILDWGKSGLCLTNFIRGSITLWTNSFGVSNLYGFSMFDVSNAIRYQTNFSTNIALSGGVLFVHGECDIGNPTYGTDLMAYQGQLSSDISTWTAQTNIPLFHSQINNLSSSTNMLLAHEFSSGLSNVLVLPKYFLNPYADGLHLTNSSYAWMGEYYAKAVYKRTVLNQRYDPVYPTNISISGSFVTNMFTGCVGPLRFDTNNVSDPGNFGFSWSDDSSKTITGIALGGAETNWVIVQLSGTPTTNKRIRYGNGAGIAGPTTGIRGNLRDSDPTVGYTSGSNLWNWAVIYEKIVP